MCFSLHKTVGQVQSQYLVWRLGHDDPAYANLSVDTAKDDACSRNSSDPSVKMEDEIQVGTAVTLASRWRMRYRWVQQRP